MTQFDVEDFHEAIVEVQENLRNGGGQTLVKFRNGWQASVVQGPYTYGGPQGLYELAAFNPSGAMDYDNPVTPYDVMGYLTEDAVSTLLREMAALTPESIETYRQERRKASLLKDVESVKQTIVDLWESGANLYHSEDSPLPVSLQAALSAIDAAFENFRTDPPETPTNPF